MPRVEIPITPLSVAMADLERPVVEIPGSEHHPRIVEALRFVKFALSPRDETPWCAAILSLWLHESGVQDGPVTAVARDVLSYGAPVRRQEAKPSDVAVFWRGVADDGVTGHVGVLADVPSSPLQLTVVGGNQREFGSDRVSIKGLLVGRLLGIRRFEWGDR